MRAVKWTKFTVGQIEVLSTALSQFVENYRDIEDDEMPPAELTDARALLDGVNAVIAAWASVVIGSQDGE